MSYAFNNCQEESKSDILGNVNLRKGPHCTEHRNIRIVKNTKEAAGIWGDSLSLEWQPHDTCCEHKNV